MGEPRIRIPRPGFVDDHSQQVLTIACRAHPLHNNVNTEDSLWKEAGLSCFEKSEARSLMDGMTSLVSIQPHA